MKYSRKRTVASAAFGNKTVIESGKKRTLKLKTFAKWKHVWPEIDREYQRDLEELSHPPTKPTKLLDEELVKTKERGQRTKDVYLVRSFLNEKTGARWRERELIADSGIPGSRRTVKMLSEKFRVDDRTREPLTVIKARPMNYLLAGLGMAIFKRDYACPIGTDPKDWPYNLRLAKARVKQRKLTRSRWTITQIYDAIIPRRRKNGRLTSISCGYCRTPILFGFILNGEKITRRKETCGSGCKMRVWRRGK